MNIHNRLLFDPQLGHQRRVEAYRLAMKTAGLMLKACLMRVPPPPLKGTLALSRTRLARRIICSTMFTTSFPSYDSMDSTSN